MENFFNILNAVVPMPIIMHNGHSNIPINEQIGVLISLNLFWIVFIAFRSIYWLAKRPKYTWFQYNVYSEMDLIISDTFFFFVLFADIVSFIIFIGYKISNFI